MNWSDFAKTVQNKSTQSIEPLKSSYGKFERYTFIIGKSRPSGERDFLDIENYTPKGYKIGDDGQRVESNFKRSNKGAVYWEEELRPCGPDSIDDRAVVKWTTPQSILANLTAADKKALNEIKSWVIKSNSAIWWHDGNADLCSKFGGPHLHIIREAVSVGNGQFQRLNTGAPYQKLCDSIKAAGGYIRSQGVKDITALVLYLNTPPRVFMGSMCTYIGGIRANLQRKGIKWEEGLVDTEEEWFADTGDEDIEPAAISGTGGQRRSDFECTEEIDAMVARLQKRKLDAGCSTGESTGECFKLPQQPPPKRYRPDNEQRESGSLESIPTPKETPKTKHVTTLEHIMEKYNKYDKEALNTLTHTLGDTHKVTLFIKYLTRTGMLQNYVASANDNLKTAYQPKTLMEFAKKAKDSDWFPSDTYYSIDKSLSWFIGWVSGQNWRVRKFVDDVLSIYDKHRPKLNTFCIIGKSNTGKSAFFNEVLQDLHHFYAIYTAAANEDRFAFAEFTGKRVAFAHEGEFGTQQMEMAKMICGGQEVDVEVKCKSRIRVYRIPFFITSNKIPWRLATDDADKLAFVNRCIMYTSNEVPGVPVLTRKLHPGLWYYLLQGLEHDLEENDFTAETLMKLDGGSTPVLESDDDEDYEIE